MSLESEGKEMRGCVSLESGIFVADGQRTTGTRGVLRGPRGPKNGSTLGYFGLGSAVSNLQTPIGGHHPVLYFQIQVTEKYSTAMCYINTDMTD